jgi:subtilase family serine protease
MGRDSTPLPVTEPNEGAQPELTAQTITRDSSYYYVTYCNDGTGASSSTFTIKLTNTATDESFTSNPLDPFSVPAPGACATTGGFTCGLIGDPNCSQCVSVRASVDSDNGVAESDESDNDVTASIGCTLTDLVPQSITRDSTYYYVSYCNNGAGTSDSKFTIKLTNTATNESFTSNPLYAFSVLAPGTCATTGGFTCGLIGDPTCSLPITVSAHVDPDNTVLESDELNNAMTVAF